MIIACFYRDGRSHQQEVLALDLSESPEHRFSPQDIRILYPENTRKFVVGLA
jgi:hypothetical protein